MLNPGRHCWPGPCAPPALHPKEIRIWKECVFVCVCGESVYMWSCKYLTQWLSVSGTSTPQNIWPKSPHGQPLPLQMRMFTTLLAEREESLKRKLSFQTHIATKLKAIQNEGEKSERKGKLEHQPLLNPQSLPAAQTSHTLLTANLTTIH